MVICGLGVLAVFCRQRVWLLMLLMIGFTVGWDFTFAGPWITENMNGIVSSIGTLGANAEFRVHQPRSPPATAKPWWPRSTARTVPPCGCWRSLASRDDSVDAVNLRCRCWRSLPSR